MSSPVLADATESVGPADATSRPAALAISAPEITHWLRRWMIAAVVVTTMLTIVTAFADDMPESHHLAAPLATVLMAGGWALELAGVRWPRFTLVAMTVLPNVWLAMIGHSSANFIFLALLVAWVGVVGSRAESLTALGLSLVTMLVAAGADAMDRRLIWAELVSWSAGLLIVWLMAQVLVRQEKLVKENARLHEVARQAAILEERQRLARDLHDSVTQALYGLSLHAEAATRALAAGETDPVAANLHEIRETTQEALGEMRLLLYELRPPLLEERGLLGALQARLGAVESRAGLVTELRGTATERLRPETEQGLYRLAQEALNNVLKHAHARHVGVELEVTTDRAILEVADDGVGFEPALRGGHGFGLAGMRERAAKLGGTLQVASAPGAGTRVRVEVPR
jgi:signal transduction histidine kinase